MINLAKANLEPMSTLTKMKTFCSTYLLYQSTTLLLPVFMLQVIYQVSMACAVNKFNPPFLAQCRTSPWLCFHGWKAKQGWILWHECCTYKITFLLQLWRGGISVHSCRMVQEGRLVTQWANRHVGSKTGRRSPRKEVDNHCAFRYILRGAHLIPVYGSSFIPLQFCHYWSLDAFTAFFVNKYADHHANEVAF